MDEDGGDRKGEGQEGNCICDESQSGGVFAGYSKVVSAATLLVVVVELCRRCLRGR